MKYLFSLLSFVALTLSVPAWSSDDPKPKASDPHTEKQGTHESEDHDHEEKGHEDHGSEKKGAHAHSATDEHGHDEHGEGEHGEGEHEEEAAPNVGPDKGILEASADLGIKLSPEALRNFEIQTVKLSGNGPWIIPASARLLSGEEVNLYRERSGAFKRIDFKLIRKNSEQITITSSELKIGDGIVTIGIGFLRIAELAAFGGAPEGHSH